MGMLEQMVITLREGVEAALIVAIALAYLRKTGRAHMARQVYAALAAAVGVSLAGAVALTEWHLDEDRFEGWLMLIAAVFVATTVYWMHRTAKGMRGDLERKLGGSGSGWGVFLLVFFMVLREGVETVLMLSAVSLNSSELLAWLGGVLGLALAVVFAVAFVRGSVRINLPRFFRITTAILVVIVAQLLLTGLHELSEGGVLPSSAREMALVGPLVRNDVFFFVVILGLAGILLWREQQRARGEAAPAEQSNAERRRALATARSGKRWGTLGYTGAFVILALIGADYLYAMQTRTVPDATPIAPVNGFVMLPMQLVGDGALHRYQVDTPAGSVRFFAIRRPDGSVAVALDACQICGAKGFYQRGNQMLCRNCDSPINISSLGTEGGCNPVPLSFESQGGEISIAMTRLSAMAGIFKK